MKKQSLRKIITLGLIAASLVTIAPVKANAEWKQDSQGWWYTEGSSYATGWREISGTWYYFDIDGYMQKGWLYTYNGSEGVKYYYFNDDGSMVTGNKIIDGVEYKFNSDGKWLGHTDEEIESLLKTGVRIGNSTIVYDYSDDTDYSKFPDGFYTKEYIENYDDIARSFDSRYNSFEELIMRMSADTGNAEDMVYVKNHRKVLSGLVDSNSDHYYIENGQFVRNSWVKLDGKYVYFNAAGSSHNNMIDGFSTIGEKLGINRSYPYQKENNSPRTYYVRSLYSEIEDKEYNEEEFNKAVNNGNIVFGIGIDLSYFVGKNQSINQYKQSWGLD